MKRRWLASRIGHRVWCARSRGTERITARAAAAVALAVVVTLIGGAPQALASADGPSVASTFLPSPPLATLESGGEPSPVTATGETDAVPSTGDAADDPAIWVHPNDPALSTIIGTDKRGGLGVYDLQGHQLHFYAGTLPNNVDVRYDFPLAGERVTLVVTSDTATNSLRVYKVDTATRGLVDISARTLSTGRRPYGLCLYRSPQGGKHYAFETSGAGGNLQQWELYDSGSGKVDAKRVRSINVGSTTEGCVADDRLGTLYVAEERTAIWKYGAEPGSGDQRTEVDGVASGHLTPDIEGLAIYQATNGSGYLLASSQGSSTFAVYERGAANAFVKSFKVQAGAVDAVTTTDGIEVGSFPLGEAFPEGVFLAHDDRNNNYANQNFKLVPWGSVARSGPALKIDTGVDPRLAAPRNTASPTISGTPRDGETLAADPGTWSGAEPLSYTYQWQRCASGGADCTDVQGATERTYALSGADVGATVVVTVTAKNSVASMTAASAPTRAVTWVAPINSQAPSISGTPHEGEILTADPGLWSGSQPLSYAYQWRRCDQTGLTCSSIADATAKSYTLASADVGSRIRVRVTASNAGGASTARSLPTSTVSARCPRFTRAGSVGTINFPAGGELSGLASSRRNPGVLWTHNDSGDTERAFAIDTQGRLRGTYYVTHGAQDDWEDIAVGPSPAGGTSYLYIGSIGDNSGRHTLYVYRVPEPQVALDGDPATIDLEGVMKLEMHYPGSEAYNAEALMADPRSGDLYVVTKSLSGIAKVFRYPAADQDASVSYELRHETTLQLPKAVTAGDISPDGGEIVLKGWGYSDLWPRLGSGTIAPALSAAPCQIPNGIGEAFGFSLDGKAYFTVSEGASAPLYRFDRSGG